MANQLIAGPSGQHACHAGHDARAGKARQPGHAGDRGRRHAEKRQKNSVARPVVLVGQVIKRPAFFQGRERRAHTLLAREQALPTEARAAVEQAAVENGVFLIGVHAGKIPFAAQARPTGVERDKMRRQQNQWPAHFALQVFAPADAHQARDALARRPPQQAAFEHAAPQRAKMPPRQRNYFIPPKRRKAAHEVEQTDLAAFARQPVEQHAEGLADARQQHQRQEMQQPQQGDRYARDHRCDGAAAGPAGPAG